MIRFAFTIFLGAFLLFQVQPILGRFILPWFGGGAGVWTACLLFFQAALLAGYAYAHLLSRRLPPRSQAFVHLALIVAALIFLPITPAADQWRATGEPDQATASILLLLALHIGVPYLLLASTGPLLQSWFDREFPGHSPYRLYSLSNLASLLALLSYPFVVEPYLTLKTQGHVWSTGFVLYAVACGWCAWRFHQKLSRPAAAPTATSITAQPPASATAANTTDESAADPVITMGSLPQTILWLSLSAVGSIMLLATTNQICMDLAVVPMLWVFPLAIYLITFIICFDADRWYHRGYFGPLLAVAVLAVNFVLHNRMDIGMMLQVAIFAIALFASCMVCHGELVRLRPQPRRLTAFYLSIAAGGAMGGAFVALVAPVVFDDYWEYHLGLLATCLLGVICMYRARGPQLPVGKRRLSLAAAGALLIGIAASLGLHAYSKNAGDQITYRNFYGVIHIQEGIDESDPLRRVYRRMRHGQIIHGKQFLDPDFAAIPTTYYGHDSGVAVAIRHARRPAQPDAAPRPVRIGVVGLGIGTIAAHALEGDYVRFYEINPQVQKFALEQFSYLAQSPAEIDVVIGDARLMLEREAAAGHIQNFDVLAIDAFNSDSIPLHLITQEAMAIYTRHIKPDTGLIAFHVSNRFVDLTPVVRGLAEKAGMHMVLMTSIDDVQRVGASRSDWIVLTRDKGFVEAKPTRIAAERPLPGDTEVIHWTDDFASLWNVISADGTRRVMKWLAAPNHGRFIIDQAQLITNADEEKILARTRELFFDTEASFPVMVVTLRGKVPVMSGSRPNIESFSMQMYRRQGLFNPHDDTGMMLLIMPDEQQFIVQLGAAFGRDLHEEANAGVNQVLIPGLQQGKPSPAIVAAVEVMEKLARREHARRTPPPQPPQPNPR